MMGKAKQSRKNNRFNNIILNIFAVAISFLPIYALATFIHGQFLNDPRAVSNLVQIEEPTKPRLFDEPLVSVTFDDGWESIYSNAAPILEKYGVRTTQYILPGEFESLNYMSEAQAKSLKNAGHEIASHTLTHPVLTAISLNDATYQIQESKAQLIKRKLMDETAHFSTPESATSESLEKIIKKTYASHRNTLGDIENGVGPEDVNTPSQPFDKYNIIAYSIRKKTTLAHIEEALQYAKATNGWLVLVYHQVDDSNSEYAVTAKTLENQLRLIKQSKVKTATLGSVLASSKVAKS